MFFIPTDCTKVIFNDQNYSNTNRKTMQLIDDFFNLIFMHANKLAKSVNLSSYCRTRTADKTVNSLYKREPSSLVIIALKKKKF